MSKLGLALMVIFSTGVLFASRRIAILGVMAATCYLTLGQEVFIGGLHFTPTRLILLVGMVRIIKRGELKDLKLNMIDSGVIAYPIVVTVASVLRTGDMGVLIYQCGASYDILLSYLVFRCLLKNTMDVMSFLRGLAFLIAPLAIFMIIESFTGMNLFAVFGGVGELGETYIRGGRIRCQGSFLSPITAGIFGATLIPLFVSLFRSNGWHITAIVGIFSAIAMTLTSNSSGPLMAFMSGSVGLMFWALRKNMRIVRWGIVSVVFFLQLVMKAPVWYLITRASSLAGGDGWHRSYLIEQAISHFPDWWLLGTSNTGDWMPTQMASGRADITNQYIASGIQGGLAALILFIMIIVLCFRNLGVAIRISRDQFSNGEFFFWCLGSVLFAHVSALLSVTYFDQTHIVWWGLLGIISSTTAHVLKGCPSES